MEEMKDKPEKMVNFYFENKKVRSNYESIQDELKYHPNTILNKIYRIEEEQSELSTYLDKLEKNIETKETHSLSEEFNEFKELKNKIFDY